MASMVHSMRLSARLAGRYAPRYAATRGFHVSAHDAAAHNLPMPALSPTMTEGNITAWRVKEGTAYSAGDILLEIETDKATMDVEAQEDGQLVKVMLPDGSKGVKVGQRIAVTADPDDDIGSLEIPKEDATQSPNEAAGKDRAAPQEESASGVDAAKSSPPSTEADTTATQGGKAQKQKYPLYPSVEHLLHENGLSEADADNIPATGPSGRLLKGDVLAYLGRIDKAYPAKSSAKISTLERLDLSNIQLAKPAPKPEASKEAPKEAPKEAAKPVEPELPQETEIAVPISLAAAIAMQKRVQDSLGIFLPLSTFIARASELANEDLPLSKTRKPTADDLFNSVLGLDKVGKSSRGHYVPHVTGLPSVPLSAPAKAAKKPDIIDLLAPKQATKKAPRAIPGALGVSSGANIFSVVAKTGDERRATEYLERLKLALEEEPGRLVL